MNVKTILFASCAVAAVALAGCSEPKPTAAPSNAGVQMTVSPTVRAMAANPTPPAGAQKATSIGKGALAVDTRNSAGDGDSMWVQQIDLNGDGTIDTVTVLWDDEDRVLFLFAEIEFVCRNGGTGAGATLVALNATGNPRNRPVGSGFYASLLDESECGARAAGIWGCRFDANGNATACGWALIDATKDEVMIDEGVATR